MGLAEHINRGDSKFGFLLLMPDVNMPMGVLFVPIFAMTGEDLQEHSPEFVSAGFTGLIRKPFDPPAFHHAHALVLSSAGSRIITIRS